MSALPTVSVVIPTYNRRDLIGLTIQSVLEQTIEDFEVIVVDDGSTDDTRDIVHSFDDSRIIYLYREHIGLEAVVRNTGICRARGKYLAFLDSDDLWMPSKLEHQIQCMEHLPDVGLCFTNGYLLNERDPGRQEVLIKRPRTEFSFERLLTPPFITLSSVLIRCDAVDRVGLFAEDPALRTVEDYHYWLRVAYYYKVHFLNELLIFYRIHTSNISGVNNYPFEKIVYLMRDLQRSLSIDDTLMSRALRHHALRFGYVLSASNFRSYKGQLAALRRRYTDIKVFSAMCILGPVGYLLLRALKSMLHSPGYD